MKGFSEEFIEETINRIDALTDEAYEKALLSLSKRQPYLYSFGETMIEIDENPEFLSAVFHYFHLIDSLFGSKDGELPIISSEMIKEIFSRHDKMIADHISDDGTFDDSFYESMEKHPYSALLFALMDEVFFEGAEYDDNTAALATQLFLYIMFLVDVYSMAYEKKNRK